MENIDFLLNTADELWDLETESSLFLEAIRVAILFPFNSIIHWWQLGFKSQQDLETIIYLTCSRKTDFIIIDSETAGRFIMFNSYAEFRLKFWIEFHKNLTPKVEPVSYVYFILNPDNKTIKIGVSKDPLQRLEALQTSNGTKLLLLGYILGNYKKESELHKKFKLNRMSGEWFKATEEMKEFVKKTLRNKTAFATCIPKGF